MPEQRDIGADLAELDWLLVAIDLAEALRLTREYVGEEKLPALEGWSWFDAMQKYEAAMAAQDEAANPATWSCQSNSQNWPLTDWDGRPWRATPEPNRTALALQETVRPHHVIVLNDYQVANLRALLYAVESGEFPGWNNGDWVGEIPWRLPACDELHDQKPNRIPTHWREVAR